MREHLDTSLCNQRGCDADHAEEECQPDSRVLVSGPSEYVSLSLLFSLSLFVSLPLFLFTLFFLQGLDRRS